jgi:hypothetical protein
MEAIAQLTSNDLDPEQLQGIARDLCRTLNSETNIEAMLSRSGLSRGSRGDPATVGTLALAFITSGAAVALVKVFEAYVSRKSSLELQLEKPDGRKLRISAQDVRPEQIEMTAKLAKEFLDG